MNQHQIKRLLNSYTINELEYNFIFSFLNSLKKKVPQSGTISNYINNGEVNDKLLDKISFKDIYALTNSLEFLVPKSDKKVNGAFFQKVLDPCCGSGAFLLGALNYFVENLKLPLKTVLNSSLFGIDICEYNIIRTRLILSLYSYMHDEVTNDSDFNLVTSDSLNIDIKHLFDPAPNGFDLIIGNPPYVKFQDLDQKTRINLQSRWQTPQFGSFNLYFPFFELGINEINEDGQVIYISPNNYYTSLSGIHLRTWLHMNTYIEKIIDFHSEKVFQAQTYTAITFLNKKNKTTISLAKNYEKMDPRKFLLKPTFSEISYQSQKNKKWRIMPQEDYDNITIIESEKYNIGEIYDIRVGIATLKDSIYTIDNLDVSDSKHYYISNNGKSYQIEKTITRPLYKISEFSNQKDVGLNNKRIIFPYEVKNRTATVYPEQILKNKFPKTWNYFKEVEYILNRRNKGNIDLSEFYEYGRSQALTWDKKKIITPTFSKKPRFLIIEDPVSLISNGYGLYFKEQGINYNLKEDKIFKLSLKILNSIVMDYYAEMTSYLIQGGYPCYQKNFIEKFCFPDPEDSHIEQILKLDGKHLDEFLIDEYKLKITRNLEYKMNNRR